MDIRVDISNSGIDNSEIAGCRERAQAELKKLWTGELHFTGWVKDPYEFTYEMIDELQETA